MEKLTIHDRMMVNAENGKTAITLNLYTKQARILISEGFTIQSIGNVPNYPDQHRYQISWKAAETGTPAYALLKKSMESKIYGVCREKATSAGGWDIT